MVLRGRRRAENSLVTKLVVGVTEGTRDRHHREQHTRGNEEQHG